HHLRSDTERSVRFLTRLLMTVARSGLRTACAQGGGRRSERVLNRRVQEVAVLVRARLADELAGEEAAVTRIAEDVTGKGVIGEKVELRADVAGGGRGPRPEHSAAHVVRGGAFGIPRVEVA